MLEIGHVHLLNVIYLTFFDGCPLFRNIIVHPIQARPTRPTINMFRCGICEAEFGSRNQLFRHLKETDEVHGKPQTSSSTGLVEPDTKRQRVTSEKAELEKADEGIITVCEDDWYRVVVKPQGLATMGTNGLTLLRSDKLLLPDALKLQLPYKKAVPCHRLDRETGGVMLCSKSKLSERIIMTTFSTKLVRKKYLAIVIGKLEPAEGIIDSPISGRAAKTRYSVTHYTRSKQYGWVTTVQLWPITGRQHQLRKHMQYVGHCIVGDKRFTMPQLWSTVTRTNIDNMFLWAVEIDFPHPKYCSDLVADGIDFIRSAHLLEGVETARKAISAAAPEVEDSDNEEEDTEDALLVPGTDAAITPAVSKRRAVIETLMLLTPEQRVVASIPEPGYYAEFRRIHEEAWNSANSSDCVPAEPDVVVTH